MGPNRDASENRQPNSQSRSTCEVITIVSGKGGTGKTLLLASMAYALIRAGQRTCLIDTDLGTQGLSLFTLGKTAARGTSRGLEEQSSLYHLVANSDQSAPTPAIPFRADRGDDHGISYDIIVSNFKFYDRRLALGGKDRNEASELLRESMSESTDKFRESYRKVIAHLLHALSTSQKYDYILVDTRGGFSELSLVPAVFADSIIVVTEPDPTSFHQLAKLLTNIDLMAQDEDRTPYIRGLIVNKCVDGEELPFRLALESQFGIEIGQTWPLPLDEGAIKSYKSRQIPFIDIAKGSDFSSKTITTFTDIFDLVTVDWGSQSKEKWRELANDIKKAREEIIAEQRRKEEDTNREIARLQANAAQAQEALRTSQSEIPILEAKLHALSGELNEQKNENQILIKENKSLDVEIKESIEARHSIDLKSTKSVTTFRLLAITFGLFVVIVTSFAFFLFAERQNLTSEIRALQTQLISIETKLERLREKKISP